MNKVLIVDDEESTRTTFSEVLNNYEFSSITASSGREAVDIFSQESPDAVLLDLKMPGMDGIETLKELKKINPDIPVILITAHGDIPTAVEAIKLGAYDFIAKPPDYKMLIIALDRALENLELKRQNTLVGTQLGEAEAKYRNLVEQIPALTYEARLDNCVSATYVSPQVEALLGFTPSEWLADPEIRLKQIHPEDRGAVIAEVEKSKIKRTTFHAEYRMFTRDGRMLWVKDDASIVGDATGRPLLLQGVMFDITKQKKTEEEIKKVNNELEQRVMERTSQLEGSNKQLRSEIIERGRIEETLQRYAEQLKALSHRLAEVQEEERRYMAKELHDEIGQALTGISLSLVSMAGMSAKETRKRLKEAQSLVSGLLDRVRNMSLTLRPAMLDDFGLLPTLLWHFKRYTAQTSIPIHFRQRCLDTRFRPEVETAVYRIVQEALTNIARHACAAEAEVMTLVEGDMLVVTVEDKGVGFEPEAVIVMKESVGLSGMRERLALLGGRLKIDSAPGRGTRLRAEIPLGDEGRRGNEARK